MSDNVNVTFVLFKGLVRMYVIWMCMCNMNVCVYNQDTTDTYIAHTAC